MFTEVSIYPVCASSCDNVAQNVAGGAVRIVVGATDASFQFSSPKQMSVNFMFITTLVKRAQCSQRSP